MRIAVAIAVVLGAMTFASVGRAESLGDAAKREEDRRKKVEDSGEAPTQVIHETELWTNKGKIANEGGSSSSSSAGTKSNPRDKASSSTPPPLSNSTKGTNDENAWRARAAGARQELADAQRAYDAVMKEKAPIQMTTWVDNHGDLQAGMDLKPGKELLERQEAAKQRIDKARAAIDALEEEARQAGALPGWLR